MVPLTLRLPPQANAPVDLVTVGLGEDPDRSPLAVPLGAREFESRESLPAHAEVALVPRVRMDAVPAAWSLVSAAILAKVTAPASMVQAVPPLATVISPLSPSLSPPPVPGGTAQVLSPRRKVVLSLVPDADS